MAATEVSLLWTGRSGSGGIDGHNTYRRQYEVITDDQDDDEQIVTNADVGGTAIPIVGEAHDADARAVVVSVEATQSDESPYIWYVDVEYDTDPPGAGDRGRDAPDNRVDLDGNVMAKERVDNPLDEPATWSTTFQDADEPVVEWVEVDDTGALIILVPDNWAGTTAYTRGAYVKNGDNVYRCTVSGTSDAAGGPTGTGTAITDNSVTWMFYATFAQTQGDPNLAIRSAVLNSTELPYDPPAMASVSKLVITVSKNIALGTATNPSYLLGLKNAVNLYPYRGYPARTLKVLNVTFDGGKDKGGIAYTTGKWEIGLDTDTWDVRLLDAGLYRLITYTPEGGGDPITEPARIIDGNGEPVTEPVPLDGSGNRLDPGAAPVFKRGVPRQMRLLDFNNVLPF